VRTGAIGVGSSSLKILYKRDKVSVQPTILSEAAVLLWTEHRGSRYTSIKTLVLVSSSHATMCFTASFS